ncbi:uncharacterized protein [Watersipora subatra]|uniref:uncharacterized protein n=1 Tax=Watersipora subatra TaxID=2589382 RepID=UPI00355C2CDA
MSSLRDKKYSVVHLYSKQNKTVREIAAELKIAKSTVHNIIKKWKEVGTIDDQRAGNSGRKRKSDFRSDRVLRRLGRDSRRKSCAELAVDWKKSTGVEASRFTVTRRLKEGELSRRRARKKPLLSSVQKKKRLDWAKAHQDSISGSESD